jgi:hypothetical protein
MRILSNRMSFLVTAGLALLLGDAGRQTLLAQATVTSRPDGSAGQARFQPVTLDAPNYGSPYGGGAYIPGPVGGALSGAADVINSQGKFMVYQQQAFQMREQVRQAKIETRRMNVDEYMYERAVLPTMEDERERVRLESLRRARNNPNPTEIWSGKALNDLLLSIQQQQARRLAGPEVPIDPEILRHINVTSGQNSGSVGMLRDGGKLSWPLALLGENFDAERKTLDQLAAEAVKQIEYGRNVDGETVRGMTSASNKLQKTLKQEVDEISAGDYMKAKRFLNELDGTIAALQDPNVNNYVSRKWSAKGNNVAELVMGMSREGLKFAPAVSGDEPAYNSLHRAMVDYSLPVDQAKRWDTLAK